MQPISRQSIRDDAPQTLAHVPINHHHRASNQLGGQPTSPLNRHPLCDAARALEAASCLTGSCEPWSMTPPVQPSPASPACCRPHHWQGSRDTQSRCQPIPTVLHPTAQHSSQGSRRQRRSIWGMSPACFSYGMTCFGRSSWPHIARRINCSLLLVRCTGQTSRLRWAFPGSFLPALCSAFAKSCRTNADCAARSPADASHELARNARRPVCCSPTNYRVGVACPFCSPRSLPPWAVAGPKPSLSPRDSQDSPQARVLLSAG